MSSTRQRGAEAEAGPRNWRICELARRYGVPPKFLSDLFWRGLLDGAACPIVRGRRQVPDHYLATVERVLKEAGALTPDGKPARKTSAEARTAAAG